MAEAADAWIRGLLECGPDVASKDPGARVVKRNPVRTVWRVPREGGNAVYLKRFEVAIAASLLKYPFVPSRARAEWDASRGLRAAGVPAAEVLGFTETRVN